MKKVTKHKNGDRSIRFTKEQYEDLLDLIVHKDEFIEYIELQILLDEILDEENYK